MLFRSHLTCSIMPSEMAWVLSLLHHPSHLKPVLGLTQYLFHNLFHNHDPSQLHLQCHTQLSQPLSLLSCLLSFAFQPTNQAFAGLSLQFSSLLLLLPHLFSTVSPPFLAVSASASRAFRALASNAPYPCFRTPPPHSQG